jgi:diphosphomevalonate decarboxylase
LLFEGQPKKISNRKFKSFRANRNLICRFLKDYHFTIDTENISAQFGIASSASGMAALAMNLMSLEKALNPAMDDYFYQRSLLARLGSGSLPKCVRTSCSLGKPSQYPKEVQI